MRKIAGFLLGMWLGVAQAGVSCSVPFNLTNGTTADASQVMANYNAILACLLNNTAESGANSSITSLSGLTTPLSPVQGGSTLYTAGTSTGSANAQVVSTPFPAGFSLSTRSTIAFIAGFTNTGATTLNVSSSGVLNVLLPGPSGPQALPPGAIVAGNLTVATYDGTQYELLSGDAQLGGFGPLTTLASATTTDLGTIASHNVNISGVTTITGFGSTASITYPFYRLGFTGALTLTNSASLLLPGGLNITTAAGDTATAVYLGTGNWLIETYKPFTSIPYVQKAPTVQQFTTGGPLTYTAPTAPAPLYIVVEMCGGGGGGGGATANNGTIGNTTTFAGWTAVGGGAGTNGGGAGGVGGTGGTTGTGTLIVRYVGNQGQGGIGALGAGSNLLGGAGAAGSYGGGGARGQGASAGADASANSCGGGQGGGSNNNNTGGGGGAGEFVKFLVSPTPATATYTVGAQANGGAAGTAAGGKGASGIITVTEFYN